MVNHSLMERIEINPDIMIGKAVIKGTRLPVSIIVEKIAYGSNFNEILEQYPFLEKDDIKAALLYAANLMEKEEVYSV